MVLFIGLGCSVVGVGLLFNNMPSDILDLAENAVKVPPLLGNLCGRCGVLALVVHFFLKGTLF